MPISANLLSKTSEAVILEPTVETIILHMRNCAWLSRAQAQGGGGWGVVVSGVSRGAHKLID